MINPEAPEVEKLLKQKVFPEIRLMGIFLYIFRVKSQLKRLARPMYSNPPIHGAVIVANVVGDPALFYEWKAEMEIMAGRIKNVRQKLYDSLSAKDKSGKDWSFILEQIGMFSFTGLNKDQVIASSQLPSEHPSFMPISFCFPDLFFFFFILHRGFPGLIFY